MFEQVVWITLGQYPNIENLQERLHLDLTDNTFEGEPTPEEKLMAVAGKKLLVVLDDLWESEHQQLLNFIHDTTYDNLMQGLRACNIWFPN